MTPLTKHKVGKTSQARVLVLLLTVLLLLSTGVSLAHAQTTESFTVNPPSTTQYTFYLPNGTTFNASILTSGTIRIWVTNQSGIQIVNLGLIDQTANFGFVANADGNYTVNFENDLPNPVQVTFTYNINPELSSGNPSLAPIEFLPIFLVILVVGSVLIFFFMRRKRKAEGKMAAESA